MTTKEYLKPWRHLHPISETLCSNVFFSFTLVFDVFILLFFYSLVSPKLSLPVQNKWSYRFILFSYSNHGNGCWKSMNSKCKICKHLVFCIHQTVQQEQQGQKSEVREVGFWTSIHQHHWEVHCNLAWESLEQFLTSPLSPFGSTWCQSGSHQNWCYLELLDQWKLEFPVSTESK